jgi:hypothetical protein
VTPISDKRDHRKTEELEGDNESMSRRVARFFFVRDTKTGKMYQINTKGTKRS